VIERLCPAVWQEERAFFRKPPFEGTLGKTLFLATETGMVLQRRSRPYQTVAELHAWRNELVHPRTLRRTGRARADVYAKKAASRAPVAFQKLRPAFTERCFQDVEALADRLLLAARQKEYLAGRELSKLGQRAFTGVVGVGGAGLSS